MKVLLYRRNNEIFPDEAWHKLIAARGRAVTPEVGATPPCPCVTCIHSSGSSLLTCPPSRGCLA